MTIYNDTLLRQWQMLKNIPKYPLKITVTQLKSKLDNDDFNVSRRTIERNLIELSTIFPLVVDDRSRPYGWSWQKDVASFNLPGFDRNEALAMVMLEHNLKHLMPTNVKNALEPQFKAAKDYLETVTKEAKLKSWVDKVRNVPTNQPLLAPDIDDNVQVIITEGLFLGKQLVIGYQGFNKNKVSTMQIHPIAMVQRGNTLYLTANIDGLNKEDALRNFALHRIKSAELLNVDVVIDPKFNIDYEIDKGLFGFGQGKYISIKLKFPESFGGYYLETKLHQKQKSKIIDGYIYISAQVADTPQLRWWILSLSDNVEIIEPKSLRSEIAKILKKASYIYLEEKRS
jgi:predicted DNA-binding transcriptional regulator YafY